MTGAIATVGALIERNAHRYPGREALVVGGLRLSYADILERALATAGGLHALGIRPQERVAILSGNRAEYLDVYGGCELAGYIAAPVNFRLAPPEVAWVLGDSRPSVLIFDRERAGCVEAIRGQLEPQMRFVAFDAGVASAVSYPEVIAGQPPAPYRAAAGHYAHLMYTSGTTGRPKGALRTQSAAMATATAVAIDFGLAGDERALVNTPLFHVGAKDYQLATAWTGGATILQPSFDPGAVLDAVASERVTSTFMVAAMLQAVLDDPKAAATNLGSIRTIMTAAAPIPLPLLERAISRFGPVFTVLYGMTESGGNTVLPRHETILGTPEQRRRLTSVGHPGFGTEMRVVDDAGEDVATGAAGEVLLRSPAQFSGYWNNTAATIAAVTDGWLHTGDIGVLDQAGYLFIVDRKKDMIISGGENVYSREVEDVLAAAPGVIEAVVIGVPDAKWGETVRAIVVRHETQTDELALIQHCRANLAKYKCPTSVAFVADLPRGATGKVDKAALRRAHAG